MVVTVRRVALQQQEVERLARAAAIDDWCEAQGEGREGPDSALDGDGGVGLQERGESETTGEDGMLWTLVDMGFPVDACRRAVKHRLGMEETIERCMRIPELAVSPYIG